MSDTATLRPSRSLATRLGWGFSLALLIPLLLLSLYNVSHDRLYRIESARNNALDHVQRLGAQIEILLAEPAKSVLFLKSAPSLQRFLSSERPGPNDLENLHAFFRTYLLRAGEAYTSIALLNRRGIEQARVDRIEGTLRPSLTTPRRDRSNEPFFTGTTHRSLIGATIAPVFLSSLTFSKPGDLETPHASQTFSVLVRRSTGEIAGILALTIDLHTMFLLKHPDWDHNNTYMVDAAGQVIFGHPAGTALTSPSRPLKVLRPTIANEILHTPAGGVLTDRPDLPGYLQSFVRIKPQGQSVFQWTLVQDIPLGPVYQEIQNTQIMIFLAVSLAIACIIILVLQFTRKTVRPLVQLTGAAADIARGHWDTALPVVATKDEVGALVTSFESMKTQLQSLLTRQTQMTEHLHITLRSIGDGVITTDPTGRVEELNPVAESLMGWTAEAARGKPLHEIFHLINEETRQSVPNPVQAVIEQGEIMALMDRTILIARDGTERPIADSAAPIRTADGELLGVVMVFRDQTRERNQHRALEQARNTLEDRVLERTRELEEEREHFRSLVNQSEGFAIARIAVDPDLKTPPHVVFASSSLAYILGEIELLDISTWLDPVIPEERTRVLTEARTALHDGRPLRINAQVQNSRKPGGEGWVQAIFLPVLGPQGRPSHYNGIILDITEATQTERKQEMQAAIIEATDDIAVVKDLELRILATNQAYSNAVGYESPDEMIGKTDAEVFGVSPDTEPIKGYMADERKAQTLKQGEKIVREETVVFTDGSRHTYLTRKFPVFDKTGTLIATANISSDITERKNLEDQLIRSERMAAVGTLAGGVAHEFNNINVSVVGFAQYLLLRGELDEEARDCLERIAQAGLRAKDITANLLTFAGVQTGKERLEDLVTVTRDSLRLLEKELAKKGITVLDKLEDVPLTVMDSTQIGQVILNLLINAQHALLDRPKKVIVIESGSTPTTVWLQVQDTGCGIPPEDRSKIFSPFYSRKGEHAPADSPQSKVRGTGLGLSVSHAIITNHKGSITASSELNQGTTFTIELPIKSPAVVPEAPTASSPTPPATAGRILVVDDEPDASELVRRVLETVGHRVQTQTNAYTALNLLQNEEFDLVMLDLQMPEMSGFEMLQRIREEGIKVRVLIMTGRPTESAMEELEEFEVSGILSKPFEIQKLTGTVAQALDDKKSTDGSSGD